MTRPTGMMSGSASTQEVVAYGSRQVNSKSGTAMLRHSGVASPGPTTVPARVTRAPVCRSKFEVHKKRIPSHARRLRDRKQSQKRGGLTSWRLWREPTGIADRRQSSVLYYLSDARSRFLLHLLGRVGLACGEHEDACQRLSPVHSTPATFPSSHHPPTCVPVSSCDIPDHGGSRRDRGGKVSILKSRDSVFLTFVPQPR